MGNRISIQFKKGDRKSVVLFSHWDGIELKEKAEEYVKELKKETKGKHAYPIQRLEPEIVMIDFIREITHKMERVASNYYLGKTEEDGDNSDNGHYEIEL